MVNGQRLLNLILDVPLLKRCDKQSLARVLPSLVPITLQTGETLYTKGDIAKNLYLVLNGHVRLEKDETDIIDITKHSFCGLEVVSNVPTYISHAIATEPSEILIFPKNALNKLIAANTGFGRDLFLSVINRTFNVESVIAPPPKKPELIQVDYYSVLGWLMTLSMPILVLWLSLIYGFNTNQGLFLSIMTVTICMWVFDLAEAFIPSLFTILAILVLGLAPQEVVFAGFASDSFFMAMSVLGSGTLVVSSGLSYRFLLWILRMTPHNQFFYNFNLLLTGIFLSPLLPSINGRAVLIAPMLNDMVELLKSRHQSAATNRLVMSAFVGITLFSSIFMSSKSANFIIYGLLMPQLQQQFQWVQWLLAASATGLIMLLLYTISAAIIYRNREPLSLSREMINLQLDVLGEVSVAEWAAIIGVSLFFIGVVTYSFHHIDPSWIAMIILFTLLLSGALDPKDFRSKVDWPFLILLGSMVGMVKTMEYLNLNQWVASNFVWMGVYMRQDFSQFILMLTLTLFVIRIVVPITAAIVIIATIFIPLAEIHGVNSWLIGFLILTIGESFYLPYQCSYYLQFQSLVKTRGIYDEKNFLWFNAWVTVIKLLAIYASIPFWQWQGII